MSLSVNTKKGKILLSLPMLLILLGSCVLGNNYGYNAHKNRALESLQSRIALDASYLDLEDIAETSNTDNPVVQNYLEKTNKQLEALNYPIRLTNLNNFSDKRKFQHPVQFLNMSGTRKQVKIGYVEVTSPFKYWTLLLPLAFYSICLFLWLRSGSNDTDAQEDVIEEVVTLPKLVVDLHNRTLFLDQTKEHVVSLSNKPLCFYLAMLKYSCSTDDPKLFQNKQLPESFVEMANSYFFRLMELGHSRRKKPDFENNIEKMLSEIRTALDDILSATPELKEFYYPQKALGEGSRSRLHNFALTQIEVHQFELIGS